MKRAHSGVLTTYRSPFSSLSAHHTLHSQESKSVVALKSVIGRPLGPRNAEDRTRVCRHAPTQQRSTLRADRTVPNRSIQKEVGKTGCEVIRGHPCFFWPKCPKLKLIHEPSCGDDDQSTCRSGVLERSMQ